MGSVLALMTWKTQVQSQRYGSTSFMCVLSVYCLCDIVQDDPEDLSFKKGDTMTVLRKDEDEWWFAQHDDGRKGSIPVPYVKVVSSVITFVIHVLVASFLSRCTDCI